MKNKFITVFFTIFGIIFLIFPMCIESYNHHLQNISYNKAHDTVISCRAKLAMRSIELNKNVIEKQLDRTCGIIPKYDDFTPEDSNGIMTVYNWIGQKVKFIPI